MEVLAARLRWRRLPASVEIISILVGYGLYSMIRLLAPHRVVPSYDHAYQVLEVERAFGLLHEVWLNEFLIASDALIAFCSYYYATAHFIVTPLVLAWVWRHRQLLYPLLRSALVLATIGALVTYATWPLAPPRFVMPGLVDTVAENPVVWAKGGAAALVNEYAAMPSLHVAWAFWCAVAVVVSLRSSWRHLAWLYPFLTTVVVMATANHYTLDAVAGAAVVLLPLALCGLRPRHMVPAPAPEAAVPTSDTELVEAGHLRQP